MGEYDILNILQAKHTYQTATELARATKLSLASIHKSLKSMRKHRDSCVEFKCVKKACGNVHYKRAVTLYRLKK